MWQYFAVLILSFFIFNTNKFVSSDPIETRIVWTSGERLTWNDFKAKAPYWNQGVAAITSSIIQYKYACKDGQLNISAKAIFNPEKSWVRPSAETKEYLNHEQLHFDITELFARRFRKLIAQNDYACNEEGRFKNDVNALLDDWQTMQKTYDKNTRYSLNKMNQGVWQSDIENALTRMSKYK